MSEMNSLDVSQQALLQLLMTKRALTDHEAQLALTDSAALGHGSPGDDVSHAFKIINRSLKMMNLEVRSTIMPGSDDNQLVHAVVNLVNDDIAKMNGTKLQPAELDVYKQAVQLIGQADESFIDVQALQVPTLKKAQMAQVLQHLVAHRWLELEEGTDNLSVGPRSYLELPDFLESNQIARSQIIYH
eukprot:CAMPEP_0119542498 /NCGR_PEP_ID=MMETSP1344-20130328/53616_1 /TAXON_ID=236787 /ORGANISM="Florenciella parvula, Strain CCMP2471" /LENGTH=186 /DNA_ID=CAMNT_0007586727 /DNA_START=71 /DNA_END=631 /DNA_ORIENTATION=+